MIIILIVALLVEVRFRPRLKMRDDTIVLWYNKVFYRDFIIIF